MVSPAFREIMSEFAPLSQLAMATLIPAVLPYGSILAAILNQAYKDGRRQTPTMTSAAARLRDSRFKSRKKDPECCFHSLPPAVFYATSFGSKKTSLRLAAKRSSVVLLLHFHQLVISLIQQSGEPFAEYYAQNA